MSPSQASLAVTMKVDEIGASHSRSRYGRATDGAPPVGMREGVPKIPVLRSRELKVFGAVEVAHHRLLPGEIETLPFKGHLSAAYRIGRSAVPTPGVT